MTYLFFDKTNESPDDSWTTERLKEEFFLCLANVKQTVYNEKGKLVTVRKYYAQARYKMDLIPVAVDSPSTFSIFVIHYSDLTQKIQRDFTEYCKDIKERNLVIFLKEVAGRFFENLDFAYYHGSVMKCLRVRLIP